MSAATPVKFRFDLDLGHREERNSVLTESALAALISKARAEGYGDGLAEGQRAQAVKAAERLAQAAERLADHAAAVNAALDDHRTATLADAVGLAAAITDCLASLDAVPHLVIRCAPELAEAVREIATTRIATSGFTGRLVVLGDPDRAQGDARIEWVDGGIARDRATLESQIDARIANFLAARRGPDAGAQ